MLSKKEVMEKYSYINDDDLMGALWIPDDIIVNTREITMLLRRLAQQNGIFFALMEMIDFFTVLLLLGYFVFSDLVSNMYIFKF